MTNLNTRVAVVGAAGRMGREIIKAILENKHIILGAALEKKNSTMIGIDVGELVGVGKLQILICNDLINVLDKFDILIDFTCPKSTKYYLSICRKYAKPMIIGTTGFNKNEQKFIERIAKFIPIVLASNFSIGINLMFKLLEKIAIVIGKYTDIKIIEAHHKCKTDIPSGTAKNMGDIITKTIEYDFKKMTEYNVKNTFNKKKRSVLLQLDLVILLENIQ